MASPQRLPYNAPGRPRLRLLSSGESLTTTAIIAAFNEEETIEGVLDSLTRSPLVDEVVVVSDGSTDRTAELSERFDSVRVVRLSRNQGKGSAMRHGVAAANGDVLFFVDGDMLDLTEDHIRALVGPVLAGSCEMNVGVRHRGPLRNFFHLQLGFGPVLSGIRAMTRAVFESVPVCYMERFKIELALNYFCNRRGFRQHNTIIRGLGHVIKENKRGLVNGLVSRSAMIREVFLLHFDLYIFQSWRWRMSDELGRSERDLVEVETIES